MDRMNRSAPPTCRTPGLAWRIDGRGWRAIAGPLLAGLLSLPGSARAGDDDTLEVAGNVLQVLLPAAAGYCAYRQDRGKDFLAGFVSQAVVVQTFRIGLGESEINQRPSGSYHGFPSGHTAAAVFGATNLARKCFPDRPALGALAYGLALIVGVSRVDSDRHTVEQVAAGALLGYFANGVTVSVGPGKFWLGYSFHF